MFFIFVFIVFMDVFNSKSFDYFYEYFESKKESDKPKIIALYFSIPTFEKLQRRYIKEFYFLEKFFHMNKVRYLILTDRNINLLEKDIDLLVVSDARFVPISTLLKFQEYSKNGKIIFTYQSLMFNQFGMKYSQEILKDFGLYDIVFVNRKYENFSFRHFTKIKISRGYGVEYYANENNVLAWSSNKTPFILNYNNYYFIAENTFCIENLSNPYIFDFNVYFLNYVLPDLISDQNTKDKIKNNVSNIEIIFPIEYILNNNKTKRYFYYSKKMKLILDEIDSLQKLSNSQNFSTLIRVGVNKIRPQEFTTTKFVNYLGKNFYLLVKKDSQGGIAEYYSYKLKSVVSYNPFIISVYLEDYISSVVLSEMPDFFELEALKAQAVAARTYAIKNRNRHQNYDLCDKPHCQNFEGEKQETFKSYISTFSTFGKIILYNGLPIDAVYHSTCGGLTANSEDVWNKNVPYLRSVKDYKEKIDDAYCKESRLFKWKIEIKKDRLEKMLSNTVPHILGTGFNGKLKNIKLQKNKSGRIEKLTIITTKSTYYTYRDNSIYLFSEDLYFSLLPSNFIDEIKINNDGVVFFGRGFGHGVGMCQFGANYLAKKYNYIQIIKHYYRNVEIDLIK
ncbi:MAG: SpoIID/LytB domain-containing protein [bacterium]|nr:SpoIID/LytB domain-containing protein [bacterium]